MNSSINLTNLPSPPFIFAGRQEELLRCSKALSRNAGGCGVMIYGDGGIGKTTLALEVAHKAYAQAHFDAYVYLSCQNPYFSSEDTLHKELIFTSFDEFVVETARVLGFEEINHHKNGTQRCNTLLEALRGQHVLLVWDNLETLKQREIDSIKEFVAHLSSPNKVILTSRERITGNFLHLRLKEFSEKDVEDLWKEWSEHYPSVGEKLHQVDPLDLDRLYIAAVGNPLVLNYALGFIADNKMDFSQATKRIQDAQRSSDLYRFLFEYAITDLQHQECVVLSALAGFATPVNFSVIAEITGLDTEEAKNALERLAILPLVNNTAGGLYSLPSLSHNYVRASFNVLYSRYLTKSINFKELFRIFGNFENLQYRIWQLWNRKPLLDPDIYQNVLRYWVNFAQEYSNDKDRSYDLLEIKRLDLEAAARDLWQLTGLPNTFDENMAQLLIDLARTLANFLWSRGYWDEHLQLSEWAYESTKALGDWESAGQHAFDIAWIYYNRAQTDLADRWANYVIEAMKHSGDQNLKASAIRLRGLVAQQREHYDKSEDLYNEALIIYRELTTDNERAIVLNDLGKVAHIKGNYTVAEKYYQKARNIAEKLENKDLLATCLGNIGELYLTRDFLNEAKSFFDNELTLARDVRAEERIAHAHYGLARILEKESEYEEATFYAKQALRIRTRLRHKDLHITQNLVTRLQAHLPQEDFTPPPESPTSKDHSYPTISEALEIYTDLEIRILPLDHSTRTYKVIAKLDKKDEYDDTFQLEDAERQKLQSITDAELYGVKLFDKVFSGDILIAYENARDRAHNHTQDRLRLRLQINPAAADLHALFWERLCYRSKRNILHFTTSANLPFSRSFGSSKASAIEDKARMLCIVSNPNNISGYDLTPLDVNQEINNLYDALDDLHQAGMHITFMPGRTGISENLRQDLTNKGYEIIYGPATLDKIYEVLAYDSGYHIVHFVGHGTFPRHNEQAQLLFEDEKGTPQLVTDESLSKRLANLERTPHLFFLAACESATRDIDSVNPFVGLVPRLVQIGIPLVIAMQGKIAPAEAQIFTRHFYSFLMRHGVVDKAMNQARSFLVDSDKWDIPVLFMRLRDGRLFDENALIIQ